MMAAMRVASSPSESAPSGPRSTRSAAETGSASAVCKPSSCRALVRAALIWESSCRGLTHGRPAVSWDCLHDILVIASARSCRNASEIRASHMEWVPRGVMSALLGVTDTVSVQKVPELGHGRSGSHIHDEGGGLRVRGGSSHYALIQSRCVPEGVENDLHPQRS